MTPPELMVALDPSMHCTGWATFVDGRLENYGVIKVPRKFKGRLATILMANKVKKYFSETYIDECVSETQEYHGRLEKMRIKDLMELHACCTASAMATEANAYTFYTPTEWNKGVPKRATHLRITEEYLLPPVKKDNDYLDAIAIGKFHLRQEYGII